jgi:hypothetical protein
MITTAANMYVMCHQNSNLSVFQVAKAEQTQLEGSEWMVVIWKWIMLKQMKNKFQIYDQLFNSGGTNLVKQKKTQF